MEEKKINAEEISDKNLEKATGGVSIGKPEARAKRVCENCGAEYDLKLYSKCPNCGGGIGVPKNPTSVSGGLSLKK